MRIYIEALKQYGVLNENIYRPTTPARIGRFAGGVANIPPRPPHTHLLKFTDKLISSRKDICQQQAVLYL